MASNSPPLQEREGGLGRRGSGNPERAIDLQEQFAEFQEGRFVINIQDAEHNGSRMGWLCCILPIVVIIGIYHHADRHFDIQPTGDLIRSRTPVWSNGRWGDGW